MQLFYIYYTGETSEKYAALNNYPCIRRACRSQSDYTYDFAVDRMLDLMVYLNLAGRERGAGLQRGLPVSVGSGGGPGGQRHLPSGV